MARLGIGWAETDEQLNVLSSNSIVHKFGRSCLFDAFDKGSRIYWELNVQPLLDAHKRVHDVAVTINDADGAASFRVYAEQAANRLRLFFVPHTTRNEYENLRARLLAEARAKEMEVATLRQADELRTNFVNAIAHELNTPLTPLKLYADAISRNLANKKYDQMEHSLDALQRQIVKTESLHKSLLRAAKLQSQNVGLELQDISLADLVDTSVTEWKLENPTRDVQVDIGCPIRMMVDPRAIRECIHHLLDNAKKFSDEQSPIAISCSSEPPRIRVTDDGRGIEASRIPELGKLLAKGHDENKFTLTGAGLGLFITKGLMRLHGGTMEIHSEGLGHGVQADLLFDQPE